jgi:phosphoribosylanthranilate isomerase
MSRTRIKICGLTRPEDAVCAVEAGADALGVVFAASPRRVTLERAAGVLAVAPPFVTRVGVFVDADAEFVAEAVRTLRLGLVQFHGAESPEACASAPAPVIKALRLDGVPVAEAAAAYRGSVAALLFDTFTPRALGGTGQRFDWSAHAGALPDWAPAIVAGGLRPDNVAEAMRTLRPYAVDVSSGVEAEPGIKDAQRLEAFIDAVRAADSEVSCV